MDILIIGIPVGFLVGYYNGCFGFCPDFKKQVDDWIASIAPKQTAYVNVMSNAYPSIAQPNVVVSDFKRELPYVFNEPISPVLMPKISTSSRVGDLRSQLQFERSRVKSG